MRWFAAKRFVLAIRSQLARGAPCALLAFSLFAAGACRCTEHAPAPPEGARAVETTATRAALAEGAQRQPRSVLVLPASAYHASVAVEGDAIYVLSPGRAYRLLDEQPREQLPIPREAAAALAGDGIVYWSEGIFWRAPFGGSSKRLGASPRRPVAVVASSQALVWLDHSGASYELHASLGDGERRLYSSPHAISALTLRGDVVSFVEGRGQDTWRLGSVSVGTGSASFGQAKSGRAPSTIALAQDRIYYYGGLGAGLRSVTPDFGSERTLATGVVCSPLALADRIYCAQVQGLVEVTRSGEVLGMLTNNRGRLITSIAASSQKVAWVSEAGDEQLEVSVLALDE